MRQPFVLRECLRYEVFCMFKAGQELTIMQFVVKWKKENLLKIVGE
jgi:hypothetical protein